MTNPMPLGWGVYRKNELGFSHTPFKRSECKWLKPKYVSALTSDLKVGVSHKALELLQFDNQRFMTNPTPLGWGAYRKNELGFSHAPFKSSEREWLKPKYVSALTSDLKVGVSHKALELLQFDNQRFMTNPTPLGWGAYRKNELGFSHAPFKSSEREWLKPKYVSALTSDLKVGVSHFGIRVY